jgi:catechol 2,3-dioxygenase-like lactoylglutathione lyase family enzyme
MVVSMTAIATTFATGHVGLNVTHLDRSVDFYRRVFGWSLRGRGDGFAFLGDDARLVITLWQQAAGEFSVGTPGLHHLSFEVESLADVQAVEARVREAGLRLYHDGIVPHSEGASSGGIFFEDPDGIRLEVFTSAGVSGEAPAGAAPTCGFF